MQSEKISSKESCLYGIIVSDNSFLVGGWFLDNSIIPYMVRSYLLFYKKKGRVYAACGVLQSPRIIKIIKGDKDPVMMGGAELKKRVFAILLILLSLLLFTACLKKENTDKNRLPSYKNKSTI